MTLTPVPINTNVKPILFLHNFSTSKTAILFSYAISTNTMANEGGNFENRPPNPNPEGNGSGGKSISQGNGTGSQNPPSNPNAFSSDDFNPNFGRFTAFGFSRGQFNIASGIMFTLTLILVVYVFKDKAEISRDTLNAILGYTASFAALSIALPAFLKDASFQEPLYRSFLLMGLLFSVATITGIITIIFNSSDSFVIVLDSKLPKLFIVPLSLRVILSLTDLLPARGQEGKWGLDHYKVLEFVIIILVIACALPYSEGETAALILMVFYASTYFLSLILALLIQMIVGQSPKHLNAIRAFIDSRIHQLTNKALSVDTLHQEIVDKFKDRSISKRLLKRLLNTMDLHYLKNKDCILPKYDFRIYYKVLGYFQKYFYVYSGTKAQFEKEFIPLLSEKLALEANIPAKMFIYTPGLSDFMASITYDEIDTGTNKTIYVANSLKAPGLTRIVNDKSNFNAEEYLTEHIFLLNDALTQDEVIKEIVSYYDITTTNKPIRIKRATFKKKPK